MPSLWRLNDWLYFTFPLFVTLKRLAVALCDFCFPNVNTSFQYKVANEIFLIAKAVPADVCRAFLRCMAFVFGAPDYFLVLLCGALSFELMNIIICLPSSAGFFSIMPRSVQASPNLVMTSRPIAVWLISRPLNFMQTLTFAPSSRKRLACLSLVSKS